MIDTKTAMVAAKGKTGRGLGSGQVTDVDPVTGDEIEVNTTDPEGTIKLNEAGAEALQKFIAVTNGLLGFVAGIRGVCVKNENQEYVKQIDFMLGKLGIELQERDEEGNIKWTFKEENQDESKSEPE